MCGINVTIGGTFEELQMMQSATQRRGSINSVYENWNIKVSFDWLPITDQAAAPVFKVGNWTVFLNGFISNHKELRQKYGFKCETNSDTEVLAHFIDHHQCENLNELNGFFSIVVLFQNEFYDAFTDRYGIKQLYKFHHDSKTFISSELKGILALPCKFELSRSAVEDWRYSLGVMTENTIYHGVSRIKCLPFHKPGKIKIDYKQAKNRLQFLLMQSCLRNKVTDLNDCVFLSGGVDSGMIAKYMKPEYSFSMDYLDSKFSEIENIKENSEGIHMTMICNEEMAEKYSVETMKALDDLKAGSCYTNFALTEMASHFATVIYSGAGGDEVFGGYPHRNRIDINQVINRGKGPTTKNYDISRDEYDWKFLRAILVIEDRMAGWHTMETRYPLLDNDFVDFALSLPDEYLKDKRILKDISGLSEKVLNSPKKGFSNPYFSNSEWSEFALKHINKQ